MGKLKKSNDKNFDLKEQDVLIGSRVLNSDTTKNRIEYFINNVEDNLSFKLGFQYWNCFCLTSFL